MNEVVLLADPSSEVWEFAKKIQAYIQSKKEEFVPLNEISINFFNNKEIDMFIPDNIRKKHVYFIHDSNKNPQEWWVELLLLKDLLLSASAESVSFVLPNLLYSRQDRKDKSHVPISARALANSISLGLKRLITMDLHAPQVQGFYPAGLPLDNLYSFPEVVHYLREKCFHDLDKLAIVSPDVGGVERARAFLQRLERSNLNSFDKKEYSFALISKTRPKAGEIEHMHLVGDVFDKDVLIIDDIIDTGTTLCRAADLLKQNGARKLFCYATHGIFTKGAEKLLEKFDKVMVSNTQHIDEEGVEVIDMTPLFAEAIYRAQKGLSISKLFD